MTTRIAKNKKAKALLLIAVVGGGSSPVLADCCDSFLGCAATIVTYGVSCEVETIISTIENLINLINNMVDLATGTSSAAVNSAKAWFHTAHDYLQSQSQQGAANLVAAAAQAQTIYKQETLIELNPNVVGQQSAQLSRSNGASTPPPPPPPPPPADGYALERTTHVPANKVVTLQSTLPPNGAFAQEFSVALKQIAALQSASSPDLSTVTQYLQTAVQTEGSGELTAASIASNAINAPLNSIKNVLTSMLTNPASAFDPSAQVQTVEDSVMSQLNTNVGKMVDNVTQGPDAAFRALGPSFGRLMESAQQAQAIAAAMDRAHKERTPGAIQALDALLPKTTPTYAGVNAKASTQATLNVKFANGLSYNDLLGQSSAMRLKATTAAAAKVQQFHSLAATLKTQVAQGKQAQTPSMLQTYQGKLNQQLSGAFDGKSASAVNAQRDQLIAQTRTRYAKDPKTQNAVIALFNSEAAKRTGSPSASTSAPLPPRPVPSAIQATSVVPPIAPISQSKPAASGSAPPAWTPPSAVKAPAPPASTLPAMKMAQPIKAPTAIQPLAQPAAKSAPSSLTGW